MQGNLQLLKLLLVLRSLVLTEILRLPACTKFDGEFSVRIEGKSMTNRLLMKIQGITYFECLYKCVRHMKCKSINFSASSGDCELNSKNSRESREKFEPRRGWSFYETPPTVRNLGPVCQQTTPCNHGKCTDICEEPGFLCICDDGYMGSRCELPFETPGFSAKSAASSCLDIRNRSRTKTLQSGMYWIKTSEPVRMYCDMDFDGGGWTKVANMNITTNNYAYSASDIRDDAKTLNHTDSPYYALSTSGLAQLRNFINFTSIRIFCRKPSVNRTIHIATAGNTTGLAVVEYMTGNSSALPPSCGSYVAYPDDNSILSKSCSRWYQAEWSYSWLKNHRERLYDHPAWISGISHIITGQRGRFECDDHFDTNPGIVGIWLFFVR